MSRTRIEIYLVSVKDLQVGEFFQVTDPRTGFGNGVHAMTTVKSFRCVHKVEPYGSRVRITCTGGDLYIVDSADNLIVTQYAAQ